MSEITKRLRDLTGQRFGKRVVVSYAGRGRKGGSRWHVRCDCGAEQTVTRTDLVGQRGRKPRLSCRACYVPTNKLPGIEAPVNDLYATYKRQAKHRGIVWNLDKELFKLLITSCCEYCGEVPSTKWRHGGFKYNGIDRANNAVGYAPNNSVPACHDCNHAKCTKSVEEFLAWIKRVAQYQNA